MAEELAEYIEDYKESIHAKKCFIPILASSIKSPNYSEAKKLYRMFEQLDFKPVNAQLCKLFKFNRNQSNEMEMGR